MIKYKVKARLARNLGTDEFTFEEFEKIFENKKNPIKARKEAYSYYMSVVDIIGEGEDDIEIIQNHIAKGPKRMFDFNGTFLPLPDYNARLGLAIYVISDCKSEGSMPLWDKEDENLIIGEHESTPYLIVVANLEEEIKFYQKNNWETDNWVTEIKYWDYEVDEDEDGIKISTVLWTTFNFWEHWNPSLAEDGNEIEEIEESNILLQIISQGENRNLEFKSSLRYCYNQKSPQAYIEHEILKTITAFANTEGGTLIIGVSDDGEVLGLQKDFDSFKNNQRDKFLKHFANIIGPGFTEPIDAILKYGLENTHSTEVFMVLVEKSIKPRFVKTKNGEKEFYIRRSATSQKLDVEEAIKYSIDKWHTNE